MGSCISAATTTQPQFPSSVSQSAGNFLAPEVNSGGALDVIVVQQQDEKSQHKNRAKAMKVLRARLYDYERARADSERAESRREQVGSGDRSERIRTYNFPQGRVTDHRINLTLYKLDRMMSGEAVDEFVDALIAEDQARQLAALETHG